MPRSLLKDAEAKAKAQRADLVELRFEMRVWRVIALFALFVVLVQALALWLL